ncbi:hypothetical protein EDB87DRAFT_8687 [Lactarius vividus]|nr:hypothetical protein EDB87DRAFT_8687 [Lactarius vividus]
MPLPRTERWIRSLLCSLAWLEAKVGGCLLHGTPLPCIASAVSSQSCVPINYISFPRNQPLDPITRGLPAHCSVLGECIRLIHHHAAALPP